MIRDRSKITSPNLSAKVPKALDILHPKGEVILEPTLAFIFRSFVPFSHDTFEIFLLQSFKLLEPQQRMKVGGFVACASKPKLR